MAFEALPRIAGTFDELDLVWHLNFFSANSTRIYAD
jgi:hypothetical protein